MDSHINDPAGVKALLEQLRSSQAWLDVVNPQNAQDATESRSDGQRTNSTTGGSATSVAALLSQLQTPPTGLDASTFSGASHAGPPHVQATPLPHSHREKSQDMRYLTFHQALPHLVRRSEDPMFRSAILEMQQEQAELERRLWEERRAIQRKHEEMIRSAQTKAAMIGAGLSRHEATAMADGFRKELHEFDRDRVLLAWDGLVNKQQSTLSGLGVPSMFVTKSKSDRERQQRVVQVLEGMDV